MNDLIERLRLGDGTSADHELLLEAADALEALAQPEQEPTAFLCRGNLYFWPTKDDYCGNPEDHIPLYTTPPQRTWVDLSDEETETLIHRFDGDPHTLLDEVNARLKEKNT